MKWKHNLADSLSSPGSGGIPDTSIHMQKEKEKFYSLKKKKRFIHLTVLTTVTIWLYKNSI